MHSKGTRKERLNKVGFSLGFLSICLVSAALGICEPAGARDQWQIPRYDPAPNGPVGGSLDGLASNPPPAVNLPGSFSTPGSLTPMGNDLNSAGPGIPGLVPNAVQGAPQQRGTIPDFFKSMLGKRVTIGTVLSGILENDLSSAKSKRGDVFVVLLPEGYGFEGEEIIPRGSKILGVVVEAFPSYRQRNGMPGRLQISLKTLVFPDGRACKFNGFIDHNPAHDQLKEPKIKRAGMGFSDYGSSFKGMLYSSVAGIAWVHNRNLRGKELFLKGGIPVAVKCNSTVDISKMQGTDIGMPGIGQQGIANGGVPGVPGLMQSAPGLQQMPLGVPSGVPQTNMANPFEGFPFMQKGATPAPAGVPGLPAVAPQGMGAPGFNAPQGTFNAPQAVPSLPMIQGLTAPPAMQLGEPDPNSIFQTPVSPPASDDPF